MVPGKFRVLRPANNMNKTTYTILFFILMFLIVGGGGGIIGFLFPKSIPYSTILYGGVWGLFTPALYRWGDFNFVK